MWKQWIKTGFFGLSFCCLGLLAGADAQAASVSDGSSRATAARLQYSRMMGNQITIAAIGALGTGDAQFKSHVRGTLAAGASQDEVIGVITVMNPYIGFPRTLNCLRIANEVFQETT